MRLVLLVGLLGACGDLAMPAVDDGDADTATTQVTPGDVTAVMGLYAAAGGAHQDTDLVALELTPAGAYVRARCYHAGCAIVVPETDHFDRYVSASGLSYLRFWSFDTSRDAGGALDVTPEIADVYEVRTTTGGLELRKSHTTRWIQLARSTPETTCTGTWDGETCTCATHEIFVAGAGGCIATPGASEARCDASDGLWTDDDATLIGSYCECGQGRRVDASGTCTTI